MNSCFCFIFILLSRLHSIHNETMRAKFPPSTVRHKVPNILVPWERSSHFLVAWALISLLTFFEDPTIFWHNFTCSCHDIRHSGNDLHLFLSPKLQHLFSVFYLQRSYDTPATIYANLQRSLATAHLILDHLKLLSLLVLMWIFCFCLFVLLLWNISTTNKLFNTNYS